MRDVKAMVAAVNVEDTEMKKDKDTKLVVDGYMEEEENPVWEAMRNQLHPDQLTQVQEDLKNSICELDHAGDPRGPGPYQAENTLMIKSHDGVKDGLIAVHVCGLCANSLAEENSDWYLFICFTCMATKWVYVTDLHRDYEEQIVGMNECPNCVGKFSTN